MRTRGLDLSSKILLILIENDPGGSTVNFSVLVNRLGRDKGQVSRALSSLKRDGLVEWSGGHNKSILICPKGREVIHEKVLDPVKRTLILLESEARVEPLVNRLKNLSARIRIDLESFCRKIYS